MTATGCNDPDIPAPTLQEIVQGPVPDQESWDTRFDVMDGEKPRMQIIAGYMAKFVESDSTYMSLTGHKASEPAPTDSLANRVFAYLYDEEGNESAQIWADEMLYFEKDRRMEAKGNVIVDTEDEKKLETEFLIWNEIERKVRTDGFVRITTSKERIQGYNLVADEDLETYEINRVTGQALIEDF